MRERLVLVRVERVAWRTEALQAQAAHRLLECLTDRLERPLELAVLVVRASDGIPGQGWWVAGGARERGYDGPWEGPEAARFIRSVQAETFAWWQSRNGTASPGDPD